MQIIHNNEFPDTLIVDIEKLNSAGQGIAKIDGFVIFVDRACPGDKLEVNITKKNKSFAVAKIKNIIQPSIHRISPKCKLQNVCGACQLQHIEYSAQLDFKKVIVQDIFHSIYGDIEIKNVIPSPKDFGYRHKIQYPVTQTKNSKKILAGYYKNCSHGLVNIKYCPIQPSYCDTIIDYIRNTAFDIGVSGYYDKKHTGILRHVVIRASEYTNQYLVTLVINSETIPNIIRTLAEKIYSELDNICGVCINLNTKKTNLIFGKKSILLYGNDYIEEKLCDFVFRIGVKTFFQVNPYTANNIFYYVKEHIKNNFKEPVILDAYAGITAFGITLSDVAKKIVSIEEVNESVEQAKLIINDNKIINTDIPQGDAGEFFNSQLNLNNKFDITILDPPRKGCTTESLEYAYKLTTSQIIYVSCNPATLARDLKYLQEKGCKIEFIQPFDMFPHTYHIECVAIIDMP